MNAAVDRGDLQRVMGFGSTGRTGLTGLKGKFGTLFLASILVVIGSTVLLAVVSLTEAFNDEYRSKATTIVHAFQAQYESLAEIQNAQHTQTHIDRLVSLNPDVYKVSLCPRKWTGDENGQQR